MISHDLISLYNTAIGESSLVKSGAESTGLTFLEQLTAASGQCSRFNVPFIFRRDIHSKKIEFARARCNQWDCKECALNNTRLWIARIIDGVNNLDADSWYFATVTAHRHHRGEKSLVNLRTNWHKLRKRMARLSENNGVNFYYARVWEHHKDGSYHMHIINSAGANTRWLKDNAAECGMGFMAHSDEIVNAGQAAGYTAKYMLKQAENDTLKTFPKGARRIEVSRNWIEWKKGKESDWQLAGTIDAARNMSIEYRRIGYQVFDLAIKNFELDTEAGIIC